jgi:transcription initiation factor TFIIA large subunit
MAPPQFNTPPLINGTIAQQRAAANLQASYGQRAAASINAIQGNAPQQPQNTQPNPAQQQLQQIQQQQQAIHQQQHQQMVQQQRLQQQMAQNGGGGGAQPPRIQMTQEQYRQNMAAQAAQQAAQAQQRIRSQNSVNGAQTDGAGDDFSESIGVVKRSNADGEEIMGRIEIDGLIRQKIEAMGQSMEGGGLMLPLHQATNSKKRQRKVAKSNSTGIPQHDGPGSDDEYDEKIKDEDADEDAINSDLDDPDEGLNEDEDDEDGMGHIMLCMYDKVQRVKNKW